MIKLYRGRKLFPGPANAILFLFSPNRHFPQPRPSSSSSSFPPMFSCRRLACRTSPTVGAFLSAPFFFVLFCFVFKETTPSSHSPQFCPVVVFQLNDDRPILFTWSDVQKEEMNNCVGYFKLSTVVESHPVTKASRSFCWLMRNFQKRKKKKKTGRKIDKAGFSIPFQRDRKRNALY